MGYRYSAIHNTIINDGKDDERVIQDGEPLRVPMTLMDSTQLAIAGSSATLDDGDVTLVSRQELADWDKAQLSAVGRGAIQDGDRVRIGDKLMVVSGRNPTNGKVVPRDASTSAQDAATVRQEAYDSYDRDIQSRYLNTRDAEAGDACTTSDGKRGTWRDKNGKMVCVAGKSPEEQEWAIAGPLSDEERVKVRDEMYAQYDRSISEAWRK
jgi:hypothetical protein